MDYASITVTAGQPMDWPARELTGWLYSPERHASEIAAFARLVHELALDGDDVSRLILMQVGQGLAELVLACTARSSDESLLTVVGSGSVWRDNDMVRDSCIKALHKAKEGFRFAAPLMEAELGAVLMARAAVSEWATIADS